MGYNRKTEPFDQEYVESMSNAGLINAFEDNLAEMNVILGDYEDNGSDIYQKYVIQDELLRDEILARMGD